MQTVEALALLASLAQSLLTGYVIVRYFWPVYSRGQWLSIRMALAFGCGVGFSASTYLLLYRFATPLTGWCFAVELVVGGLVAWRVFVNPRHGRLAVKLEAEATPSWGLLALAWFFVANALVRFVTQSLYQPLGATDAFTMWNVRARYLYSIRDDWASAFEQSFNTPDYPLLLPAFVARAWKAMGSDTALAPSAVALLFTLSIILCLFGVLRTLRGRNQACLGIIGLLSAPMFIFHSATQYADIVMAYFMCAAVGTTCVRRALFPKDTRLLTLVGFLAGLAAWTKNEGVLFSLTMAVAIGVVAWRADGWPEARTEVGRFISGLAAPMAALIYFKIAVVPPSEFVSEQAGWGPMLGQLLELDRHIHLITTAVSLCFYFVLWPSVLPALVVFGFCVGFRVRPGEWGVVAYPALVITQVCLGYYCICLIGPHDFTSYVDYSAFRLLVQLWPLIMLLAFLVIKPWPPGRAVEMESPGPR